jgi:hypothetical protein
MKNNKLTPDAELLEVYYSYVVVITYRAMMQTKRFGAFAELNCRLQKATLEWRSLVSGFKYRYY